MEAFTIYMHLVKPLIYKLEIQVKSFPLLRGFELLQGTTQNRFIITPWKIQEASLCFGVKDIDTCGNFLSRLPFVELDNVIFLALNQHKSLITK